MIRKLFSFVTLMLILASCANDIDNSSRLQMRTGTDNKLPVFYATIEGSDDAATKVFADEQLRVLWNADDRITVFNKHSYGYEYSFTGEDGDNAGEFAAVPNNNIVTGNPLDHVYALYPHDATTEISNDGIITATLPAKQTYKADSFGIGANTMVSVTDDTQLRFKNVGGYLSFKFYGDNVSVTRITLRGNNHEKIAGNASISMTVGGTPTVEMREDATESITLMCDTPVRVGSTADNPTEFWFVLPPTDFTKGITVTVVDDKGGFFEVNSSTRLIFERNKLSRLAAREIVPAAMIPPDNEIWYTTTNNAICDYESWSIWSDTMPFNSNVISHTYEDGKGIIRCDGPITAINDYAFWNDIFSCINGLFLPNSVTSLGVSSLSGTRITELRLPDNLTSINMYSLSVPTLARLYGNNVSEDGRCVIYNHYYTQIDFGDSDHPEGIFDYVDGYVVAFAPGGPSSYSLPSEATILGWYAFAGCHLENITFNEGLKKILGDCFLGARLECVLELPSTLEELNAYAFNGCTGIKGICGNEKFHTADNRCLIYQQKNYDPASGANGTWIGRFFGPDVTDYSIPEGIVGIENYAFDGASNLKTVTFPHSMREVGAYAFYNCKSLKEVYGDCASTDHKGIVFGSQFRRLAVTNNVTHYTVPDGITSIGYSAFERCGDLEEIILPDSVTELGGYDFAFCDNLKKVVLSSSLERINSYNPFLGAWNLEEIYFRSFIPPQYSDDQFYEWDRTKLKIYVPEETLIWYKTARQWSDFAPYMVGYKYDDIGEWAPDHYISLDYSANGEVTMLQTASKGNGIHVILMGDAFSDRQIADGSYARAMQRAKEALFSQEPYKSM